MSFPSTQVEVRAALFPWLSSGLVAISLCFFLATPAPPPVAERTPAEALEAAFAFWRSHAYLAPDAQVLGAAREHFGAHRQRIAIAALRELGRRAGPGDDEIRDREQATLDGLSELARPDQDSINPLPHKHSLRAYGFTPAHPSLLTSLTHFFVYAGWIHLLPVLLFLFIAGASAEQRWGAARFAVFLAVSAFVSVAAIRLLEPESQMSSIGAVGPVTALVAAFALHHGREPVRMVALAPHLGGLRFVPFELPGPAIPALWLAVCLGLALWLDAIGVRNGLSLSAPVGGLGIGLPVGAALRWARSEPVSAQPDLEAETPSSEPPSTPLESPPAADAHAVRPEPRESDPTPIAAAPPERDPETPPLPATTPGDEPARASLPRFHAIRIVEAVPTRLADDVLYFRLDKGRKARIAYERIEALAVVALRESSSKPVVVIDLLLNWSEAGDLPLRAVRLRSDQFDPARLVAPVGSPTENLRAFLEQLQQRSGAVPLPDLDAVRGRPFRAFEVLRRYQRQVLRVDC